MIANSIPNTTVKVEDFFVIPDYTKMLENCGDSMFGDYAKSDHTQLQFSFESVPVSSFFPTGVKVTYRKYSSEEVVELREEQNPKYPEYNVCPRKVRVQNYPKEKYVALEEIPTDRSITGSNTSSNNSNATTSNTTTPESNPTQVLCPEGTVLNN